MTFGGDKPTFGGGNKRDLQTAIQRNLDRRRFTEADIKHPTYVSPFGNGGLHRVKSRATGQVYIVSGPQKTFRPDTIVPEGSRTGTQGAVILISPPPGQRGSLPPTVITQEQAPIPILTGEFGVDDGFPSSGFPFTWSSGLTGLNFSPSNTIELIDVYNTDTGNPYPNHDIVITGTTYVSETAWTVNLWMPLGGAVDYRWRISSGSFSSDASSYLDPDPDFRQEGRWRITGL